MPNTYACKGVSNPNVPMFPPRVCTLVFFIIILTINIVRTDNKLTFITVHDMLYSHVSYLLILIYYCLYLSKGS